MFLTDSLLGLSSLSSFWSSLLSASSSSWVSWGKKKNNHVKFFTDSWENFTSSFNHRRTIDFRSQYVLFRQWRSLLDEYYLPTWQLISILKVHSCIWNKLNKRTSCRNSLKHTCILVFLLANILSRFFPSSSISLPSSLLLSSSVDRTSVDDRTLQVKKEIKTCLFYSDCFLLGWRFILQEFIPVSVPWDH